MASTPLDIDLSTDLSSAELEGIDDTDRSLYGEQTQDTTHGFSLKDEQPIPLCPHCGSRMIKRVHRGFIRKFLLKTPPLHTCIECKETFEAPQLSQQNVPGSPQRRSTNQ